MILSLQETYLQMTHNTAMDLPSGPTLTGMLCLAVALPVLSGSSHTSKPEVPDFDAHPAGEARKAAFFGFLGPLVDAENALWRSRRARLEQLADKPVDADDQRWLEALARFFEVPEDLPREVLIDRLLNHVDTVPRALALAQAAKESAWGTSRFAREGNNYFGQRCYTKGCGMVPKKRPAGAKYEVRRFESPADSVASYFYNINSHLEYAELRDYRSRRRDEGQRLSGIRAAEEITQYSERRRSYVDEIQSLIYFNDLEPRAQPH